MKTDTLVRMINQIAASQSAARDPAGETARHIRDFWDPRMRAALAEHLDAGGEGLSDSARAAAMMLRETQARAG